MRLTLVPDPLRVRQLNCVWTLMSHAYKVRTSYILLHNELCFFFFLIPDNGINTRFNEKQIQKFLNKQYNPSVIDAPEPSIFNFFCQYLTLDNFSKNIFLN